MLLSCYVQFYQGWGIPSVEYLLLVQFIYTCTLSGEIVKEVITQYEQYQLFKQFILAVFIEDILLQYFVKIFVEFS